MIGKWKIASPSPPSRIPLATPHPPSSWKHPLRAFPPRAARGGRNIGWCYTSERVSGGYHNCWNSAFYSPRNYDRGPAAAVSGRACVARARAVTRSLTWVVIMGSTIWYTSTSGSVTHKSSHNSPDTVVRFKFSHIIFYTNYFLRIVSRTYSALLSKKTVPEKHDMRSESAYRSVA